MVNSKVAVLQDSRNDLTLPVFTPEVKGPGGLHLNQVYPSYSSPPSSCSSTRPLLLRVSAAFFAGVFVCLALVAQYASSNQTCLPFSLFPALLPTHVGTPEWHEYPPAEPTNAFPSMFPSNVGYPGPTQAGAEPGVAATAPAYPLHSGSVNLVPPTNLSRDFDIFRSWGSLSPWYSIKRGRFGVDSSPEAPDTCRITGVHLLHRHGARYPADFSKGTGPGGFASKLNTYAENATATGPLSFLNDWTYKLGNEGLTPFGRSQLYDLGVSMRMRYGFLLKNFSETNTLPVFRTESQTRMLNSAQHFALGFFGYPLEGQYQQQIMIEAKGFNNTLAPYRCCANNDIPHRGYRGEPYANAWKALYLRDAVPRLQTYIDGLELNIEDVYAMQELCAFETVALGYSKFCELFTEGEWEGFDYSYDLNLWYGVAWGSPVARGEGIGYVQELVSRLTHTPIETHNSSTNATHHNILTFPFGHSLYVDATHEVVVLNVLTALNLSSFAAMGPLPTDHIPKQRTFRTAEIAPFATNVQFQLLSCSTEHDPQIRVIVNDGVVPLDNLKGCPENPHGMCSIHTFVDAQKENIRSTDWDFVCNADWIIPDGWETTMGYPPL
ncbi:phosphoglycerate mutase-like protein [Rhizopogon vinicolor AM-OR11-026]|uniref:Phosphoglycerate mutase-like protein n=1 Tax=Rhizopogon vinicolor AM-OR11-026 TaxID=1314800 RepID=A0A1B7N3R1_9AGAM|nr:phosphoglycerate mutase-like protein [Rhizopogon vinicolor AM-OR11-026]